LLFDFLLFYIAAILAIQTNENDRTTEAMLADSHSRATFIFTVVAFCYIPGTLAYLFLQDFAVLTVMSLIATTALSSFVNTSDGQQALWRALVNGGIWILCVGAAALLFCCCAVKWCTDRATNFIHTLMEPILVGMTISFCFFVFVNTWPYYLRRQDNNFYIFWLPMMVGAIIAAAAVIYRWDRGNAAGLRLLKQVEFNSIKKKKKRKKEEEEEEEEDDELLTKMEEAEDES
jgi:hypothetical protein